MPDPQRLAVQSLALVDPFHAIAISRIAHELEETGASVIHMEFGQPPSPRRTGCWTQNRWAIGKAMR